MQTGTQYRVTSSGGVLILAVATSVAVGVGSATAGYASPADRSSLLAWGILTAAVIGVSLRPFYPPRPWRLQRLAWRTVGRVGVATLFLTVVAYAATPWGVSPAVSVATGLVLAGTLPWWVWTLGRRQRPATVVVGDDPSRLAAVIDSLPAEPLGFVSPPMRPVVTERPEDRVDDAADGLRVIADGSGQADVVCPAPIEIDAQDGVTQIAGVERLGGLARLDRTLRREAVDTVALAFHDADRGECFGTLERCRTHGVEVVADEVLADAVLTDGQIADGLVRVETAPWPWYSSLGKRAFDVCFAILGLVLLAPAIVPIAVAIKLDSRGPIFYEQARTAAFGDRFRVRKFRTMRPEREDPVPGADEADRVTRVGHVLRKTHLDEVPQLVSVLTGDMTVVGPRAVWIDEERHLERSVDGWRRRWHVPPGLTGLAQVNDATSATGRRKLAYDLAYIDRRTFLLDVQIVAAQCRLVLRDATALLASRIRTRVDWRWLP